MKPAMKTVGALLLRSALVLGGLALLAAASLYLAGHLYFLLNKAIPSHITLSTWWQYWQAYGGLPAQRPRLIAALVLPPLAALLLLPLLLRASPRSLYGDARWASTQDIHDAGLL